MLSKVFTGNLAERRSRAARGTNAEMTKAGTRVAQRTFSTCTIAHYITAITKENAALFPQI